MEILKNRYILVISIVAVLALTVNLYSYDIYNKAELGAEAIKNIPINIGEWKGHDEKFDDSVYEILETKSIIHRAYLNKHNYVFLSLVHYPETKVDFHAPEACLGGKGIEIDKSSKTIGIDYNGKMIELNINELTRQENKRGELVYYFYKAGNFMGKHYIKLRLKLVLNKFSENSKSGSLIRVSTYIDPINSQTAENNLRNFLENLYPYLVKYL